MLERYSHVQNKWNTIIFFRPLGKFNQPAIFERLVSIKTQKFNVLQIIFWVFGNRANFFSKKFLNQSKKLICSRFFCTLLYHILYNGIYGKIFSPYYFTKAQKLQPALASRMNATTTWVIRIFHT